MTDERKTYFREYRRAKKATDIAYRERVNGYQREYARRKREALHPDGMREAKCSCCGKIHKVPIKKGRPSSLCEDCKKLSYKKREKMRIDKIVEKKKPKFTINEIVRKATELHLSYGKYIEALEKGEICV